MALLNVDWECVDSAAIRCYGRTGQLGAVRRLWQQLTKAEVSPSVFTFNSLLDGTYFFELIKGTAWHTLLKFLFDHSRYRTAVLLKKLSLAYSIHI
jgi:pentatricopeptide repeat protein